ncbi:MAG: lysophospholipid acyltransferase family protein [Pseudobdellovibrionaceae bacterium]
MRSLIAVCKILAFLLWGVAVVPPQLIVLIFTRGNAAYVLPRLWHKGVCRIFGLKAVIAGEISLEPYTLFTANHLSWLDIPIMGAHIPRASFVAKREVASWPLFGFLSKLQQTAFIDRSRSAAKREADSLGAKLAEGRRYIIFPEGTSGNGTEILPFKSNFFETALQIDTLKIQPFTVRILTTDGKAAQTQSQRDIYAWHGDMELLPHFWGIAKSRGAQILLVFHKPFPASRFQDRKVLAQETESIVRLGQETPLAA